MCGDFEMLLNNNTISFPESNFIINETFNSFFLEKN